MFSKNSTLTKIMSSWLFGDISRYGETLLHEHRP